MLFPMGTNVPSGGKFGAPDPHMLPSRDGSGPGAALSSLEVSEGAGSLLR